MKNIIFNIRVSILILLFIFTFIIPSHAAVIYHGNVSSKIFHHPTCRYYDGKYEKVNFKSIAEAETAGYTPCKICFVKDGEKTKSKVNANKNKK